MDVKITPQRLFGEVKIPPSKSISHRALIAAALSDGTSHITDLLDCMDTRATISALAALGASIEFDGKNATVKGISRPAEKAEIDCKESGSTLRFIIPVAAALGCKTVLSGSGKLPQRPITPYLSELGKNGISFDSAVMPYKISGKLKAGVYTIDGGISSQFITGLLLSLPLLSGDSAIELSAPLQSKPYVDITIDVLKRFGIEIIERSYGYYIRGGQKYKPCDFSVEADMSQAAFFLTANCLGGNIQYQPLNSESVQGDAAIISITKSFSENGKAFDVSAEQIPDLVPILTVLACFADGTSHIRDCARLRIKESDRLFAISTELNKLGADVKIDGDDLVVCGVKALHGGECDGHNDHRIAMALAIASIKSTEAVIIKGAECVKKSYPDFFADFEKLGGKADVI